MSQRSCLTGFFNNIANWISGLKDMTWYTFKPEVTWDTWIQFILLFSGFFIVWRQFKQQRKLQVKQHKDTIQYNVYEKLVENFENSQPTSLSTKLNIIMNEFDKSIERVNEGQPYTPPPFYLDDIHNEFMVLHTNLLRLLATIDKYRIVSKHLSLFKKIISQKITELGNEYVTLVSVFAYILLPNKETSNPLHVPNQDIINKIKDKVLLFDKTSWDIACFLDDILTESQNALLGEFFKHKLSVREPKDPKELVLTSTNQKMIDKAQEFLKNVESSQ